MGQAATSSAEESRATRVFGAESKDTTAVAVTRSLGGSPLLTAASDETVAAYLAYLADQHAKAATIALSSCDQLVRGRQPAIHDVLG
jgi:hypothetical protein